MTVQHGSWTNAAPRRTRGGWYLARTPHRLVLARHWPPRLDLAAETCVPPLRRGRLAHQVRQDVWRALCALRGFSPVIEVVAKESGTMWTLCAGGRCAGRIPRAALPTLQGVLDDPANRARWFAHAARVAC